MLFYLRRKESSGRRRCRNPVLFAASCRLNSEKPSETSLHSALHSIRAGSCRELADEEIEVSIIIKHNGRA
jgi:hypothetical protein